jgi:hypothetical protein
MDESRDVFVNCYDDFPRCMVTRAYPSGRAVRISECKCEVAWKAVAEMSPKVTIKTEIETSKTDGQNSACR